MGYDMKFEDLLSNWEKDSEIDRTELADESLKIPKLHHKYYSYYVIEKANLRKLEADYKKLKLEKHEFYTQGPNEETARKGWKLPARGLIIKADIPMYIESDEDIIELSLKIGIQQEKVDFLESVIKSIHNRGYAIRNAIDFIKWTSGN